MAKQPGHRYSDAASFAADLRRYLRGEPVQARRAASLVALWWKCRRKPVQTGLAAALLFSMACGFAGITWQWRRAEDQRVQAVQALNSATDTIQSLVRLHTTPWEDSDEPVRQIKMILDSLLAPIVDEARAYPELRNSLASASMGSLRLVDHVLPREDALSAHREDADGLREAGTPRYYRPAGSGLLRPVSLRRGKLVAGARAPRRGGGCVTIGRSLSGECTTQ